MSFVYTESRSLLKPCPIYQIFQRKFSYLLFLFVLLIYDKRRNFTALNVPLYRFYLTLSPQILSLYGKIRVNLMLSQSNGHPQPASCNKAIVVMRRMGALDCLHDVTMYVGHSNAIFQLYFTQCYTVKTELFSTFLDIYVGS